MASRLLTAMSTMIGNVAGGKGTSGYGLVEYIRMDTVTESVVLIITEVLVVSMASI